MQGKRRTAVGRLFIRSKAVTSEVAKCNEVFDSVRKAALIHAFASAEAVNEQLIGLRSVYSKGTL